MSQRLMLAVLASLCFFAFVSSAEATSVDARFPHLERAAWSKLAPKHRVRKTRAHRHYARHHRHARRHHARRHDHHRRRQAWLPRSSKPYGLRPHYERLNVGNIVRLAGLPRFVFGRLVCAVNVNRALAARGIRGTGSALAKSFLRWGRPSGPVPGAVAIYNRGRSSRSGHVAIVSRVVDGKVYVWNPGRQGWREVIYRRPPIAYRIS